MKQLLLILSVGLLTVGSGISQNRYSWDEVVTPGKAPNDTITYLKFDMKPVAGMVYCEFGDMGKYVNGKPDGLHRSWHDNGQLLREGNCKDGKEDGLYRSWWVNGQLWVEHNFKDGEKDGLERWWYENGQLLREGNYKDGEIDGLCRWWYEDGQLKLEVNYKDGQTIYGKRWDEHGNLTKDKIWPVY